MSEPEIIEKVKLIVENESISDEQKEEVIEYALHEKLLKILNKPS